mmetsp:Transcript_26797/g.69409  ORF Transcript_26797/g.69409 Transcript_26797/m.69409 type:complete len:464 (-) Transcript_26797:823-2214(-)
MILAIAHVVACSLHRRTNPHVREDQGIRRRHCWLRGTDGEQLLRPVAAVRGDGSGVVVAGIVFHLRRDLLSAILIRPHNLDALRQHTRVHRMLRRCKQPCSPDAQRKTTRRYNGPGPLEAPLDDIPDGSVDEPGGIQVPRNPVGEPGAGAAAVVPATRLESAALQDAVLRGLVVVPVPAALVQVLQAQELAVHSGGGSPVLAGVGSPHVVHNLAEDLVAGHTGGQVEGRHTRCRRCAGVEGLDVGGAHGQLDGEGLGGVVGVLVDYDASRGGGLVSHLPIDVASVNQLIPGASASHHLGPPLCGQIRPLCQRVRQMGDRPRRRVHTLRGDHTRRPVTPRVLLARYDLILPCGRPGNLGAARVVGVHADIPDTPAELGAAVGVQGQLQRGRVDFVAIQGPVGAGSQLAPGLAHGGVSGRHPRCLARAHRHVPRAHSAHSIGVALRRLTRVLPARDQEVRAGLLR